MDDITEMILAGARCQTCGGIIKAPTSGPRNCYHCDTMKKEERILLSRLLGSSQKKIKTKLQ